MRIYLPFKVIALGVGTNRKRVCDFLLVHRSNLGPILHRFRDIADFYAHNPTPSYSTLIFGMFSLDHIADVGESIWARTLSYSAVKLFSKYCSLCDHNTWTSQTDGQTDNILWHNRAVCIASRGKNDSGIQYKRN